MAVSGNYVSRTSLAAGLNASSPALLSDACNSVDVSSPPPDKRPLEEGGCPGEGRCPGERMSGGQLSYLPVILYQSLGGAAVVAFNG